MASVGEFAAATRSSLMYMDEASDVVSRGKPLLHAFWGNGKFKEGLIKPDMRAKTPGGEKVEVALEVALANMQLYGDGVGLEVTPKEILDAAYFSEGALAVSQGASLNESRYNRGDAQLVDLAELKINNLRKSITHLIGISLLYKGSELKTLLDSQNPNATNIANHAYASIMDMFGVNRSNSKDATSTEYGELAESLLGAVWTPSCVNASGNFYATYEGFMTLFSNSRVGDTLDGIADIGITTETLYNALKISLQPSQFIMYNEWQKIGFQGILVDGVHRLFTDFHLPAGYAMALNTKRAKLLTNPKLPCTNPEWEKKDSSHPDDAVANSRWGGTWITDDRRAHALMYNMAAA